MGYGFAAYYISYWVFLPEDWGLFQEEIDWDWYEIGNPYSTSGGPYSAIYISHPDKEQKTYTVALGGRDAKGKGFTAAEKRLVVPKERWFEIAYLVHRHPANRSVKLWFDRQLPDGGLLAVVTAKRKEGRFDPDGPGLYRWEEGSRRWQAITPAGRFAWPKDVSVGDPAGNTIYLGVADAGDKSGGLYATSDGGASWKRVLREGAEHFGAYPDPARPGWIYITDSGGLTQSATVAVTILPPPVVYSVNFTAGPGGTLTGSASQLIEEGSTTTALTAVPDSGHTFVNWTWDGGSSTSNPLALANVTQNWSITANFSSPSEPFAAWVALHSLTGTSALPTTDLLGDGMSNLLRYALGGTPTTPAAPLQPVPARRVGPYS